MGVENGDLENALRSWVDATVREDELEAEIAAKRLTLVEVRTQMQEAERVILNHLEGDGEWKAMRCDGLTDRVIIARHTATSIEIRLLPVEGGGTRN